MKMQNHSRRNFLKYSLGLTAGSVLFPGILSKVSGASRKKKPNVIIFMVDDMGWTDSSVYGSTFYETPNLERLAKDGMMFTNAYAANPLCSPTRASIMTGKNPDRTGVTTSWGHLPAVDPSIPESGPSWQQVLIPHPRTYLPSEEYTLAEAMKDARYSTGFIGKWHLGKPSIYWPDKQGFDLNIGGSGLHGPKTYFSPYENAVLEDGPEGEHITDRLTSEAIKFIDDNKSKPFFLCLWTYSVHTPLQAKKELIAKYDKKKDLRGIHNCSLYAAMIETMDTNLGRLLDALEKMKLDKDTIIIFASDNGPTKSVVKDGHEASNAKPLRGKKGTLYEGGIRIPMIVRWPGVVKAQCRSDEIVTTTDFYPTVLDMVGESPKPGQVTDGISFVPVLKQQGHLRRDAIYFHSPQGLPVDKTGKVNKVHVSGSVIRRGDWKLIRRYATNEYFPRYELFNLKDDLGEIHNLATEYPDRVRQMELLLDKYLEKCVVPLPKLNPDFKESDLLKLKEQYRKTAKRSFNKELSAMYCRPDTTENNEKLLELQRQFLQNTKKK
ncbi:MAG: sulfatase [Planctomycetota bacterium]|jgi:arylsulfatase A-like enzyme